MKKVLLVLLLFLFIYNIPFVFLPVSTAKLVLAISFFLFLVYFLIKKNGLNRLYLNRRIMSPFLLVVLLIFYSFATNVFHGTNDYTFIYTYSLFIIEYVLGAAIIIYLIWKVEAEPRNKRPAIDIFLDSFILMCVVQSILIYGMMFIQPFRDFSFSILESERRLEVFERYGGFRGLGYASTVTYDFAVLQSFALMLIARQLFFKTNFSKRQLWQYMIAYVLIFGGVLVSGRTGFIGVGMSFILMGLFSIRYRTSQLFFNKRVNGVLLVIFTLLGVVWMFYGLFVDDDIKTLIEEGVFNYAFEMITNLFETGSATTRSTERLSTMYFPVPTSTLIFGDGVYFYEGGGFYKSTDAGYMRQMLFYGVIGSFLLYLFYIVLNLKINGSKVSKEFKLLFFLLIVYMFIVQYKGDIMMGSPFCIKFIFIFYLLLMSHAGKCKSKPVLPSTVA